MNARRNRQRTTLLCSPLGPGLVALCLTAGPLWAQCPCGNLGPPPCDGTPQNCIGQACMCDMET